MCGLALHMHSWMCTSELVASVVFVLLYHLSLSASLSSLSLYRNKSYPFASSSFSSSFSGTPSFILFSSLCPWLFYSPSTVSLYNLCCSCVLKISFSFFLFLLDFSVSFFLSPLFSAILGHVCFCGVTNTAAQKP